MAKAKTDFKPAVMLAGVLVVGGVIAFSVRKKRRCTKLPEIWEDEGPLHLTRETVDEAIELARHKIREYVLAGKIYKLSDVQMYVADGLRDCSWENLKTDEQKQAWAGIREVVNDVNQRAKQDPDEFLSTF